MGQGKGGETSDRKKGGGKGGVSKRSKYRTEEEKVAKERDRRNANNQRERSALCPSCVTAFFKAV